jgi:hypothetical protein
MTACDLDPASPAAIAYMEDTRAAYARYEEAITVLTAGAAARWERDIHRARSTYEANGGTTLKLATARNTAATAASLAAASLALAAAVPASAASHAPRCKTGQIAIVLVHPVQSGGSAGWTVEAQDKSGVACTISDYPRLGLQGRLGLRLRSTVIDGSTIFHDDPGPSSVILQPGGFAEAWLAYGTVSGPGSVRAHALTVRTEGAASHKTAILASGTVPITRAVVDVTAWKLRKG